MNNWAIFLIIMQIMEIGFQIGKQGQPRDDYGLAGVISTMVVLVILLLALEVIKL